MESSADVIVHALLAAALGGLIGLERQVSMRHVEGSLAGMRTFSLYGLWGLGSAWLGSEFGPAAFAVTAGAFGALIVAEYVVVGKQGATGTTTEAASFVAFLVGVLVWAGFQVAALGIAVGVAALLQSKVWLHGRISAFSGADMRAVLRFGVLTAVILPLVPNRFMGPFEAFNPFQVWRMVVFVAAIGLVGYIALRVLGPRGLGPTGLVGGLVSSTAVTLGFSRMARKKPELSGALGAGILAASGLMYLRVLIWAIALAPALARVLVVPLVGLFFIVEGVAAVVWWRATKRDDAAPDFEIRNPVTLTSALQFGLIYAVVVVAAKGLVDRVSDASLSIVGAISGINDVDAITLATSNFVAEGSVGTAAGAAAVMAAVAVNTVVKGVLATGIGGRALGRVVAPVLAIAGVGAFGVWLWFA
ncbi:MAG TPA: DUF4010 domain-containing protein [Acidimicrobiia bacterium]|nr:DUF4010 domain-containing protein [Acidimicrobiia bacterium]